MTKTGFQRARQPAQKEQRRRAILAAAAELLEAEGLDGVTLNGIARAAGLAKSNLYRYFESREEILLELVARDEAEWVEALEAALAPHAGADDPEVVARCLAQTLAAYPRLCLLTTVLANVLEQNLSVPTAVRFKTSVSRMAIRISNAIHAALPSLPPSRMMPFQRYVHALIAGLWPIAHPTPVAREVLAREEFAHFRADFETDLRGALTALLVGLR